MKRGDKSYRYLSIVEAYREGGKKKQKVIAWLGRADKVDKEKWIKALSALSDDPLVPVSQIEANGAWDYGDVWCLYEIWQRLEIDQIIWGKKISGHDFGKLVGLMAINRCVEPRSKRALPDWYEQTALSFMNGLKPEDLYPQMLYRAMDELIKRKDPIERGILARLKEYFDINLDTVFYDTTSSYFEGDGPDMAEYGYSREHRPDKKQVNWGLAITPDGFPITHQVYNGNIPDKSSLDSMRKRLMSMGVNHVTVVIDRGMVSRDNLDKLVEDGYHYICALPINTVDRLLDLDLPHEVGDLRAGDWIEDGRRYIVCYNPDKVENDRIFRERRVDKGRKKLDDIARTVDNGRLKDEQKIIARAAKSLEKLSRYFTYSVVQGRLRYEVREDVRKREERRDGKWVLETDLLDMDVEQIVNGYKSLNRIERSIRTLKSFIKVRPIGHYTDDRVKAHLFICILSYLLEEAISHYTGKEPDKVLDVLHNIKMVNIKAGNLMLRRITEPTVEQKRILKDLGIHLRKTWLTP